MRSNHSLRLVCLCSAAAVIAGAGLTAGAFAQLDTELTPIAKSPTEWTVLAGARWEGDGDLFPSSPTTSDVDFFSTAFSPTGEVGLFGGWECTEDRPFSELDACESHRPAVFRYATDEGGEPRIARMSLPVTGDSGYIAAIAWLDAQRALAVGGTKTYPRREPPAGVDDVDYAGEGRAWLYEGGAWTELRQLPDGTAGDEVPDGALTAVDCVKGAPDFGDTRSWLKPGVCLAGGLRKMWGWGWRPDTAQPAPEGFELDHPVTAAHMKGLAPQSTPPEAQANPDFAFRVRQIRFSETNTLPLIAAVTSGCCAPTVPTEPTGLGARMLMYGHNLYQGVGGAQTDRWISERLPLGGEDVAARGGALPDSYFGVYNNSGNPNNGGVSAIAVPGGAPSATEAGTRTVVRIWSNANTSGHDYLDADVLDRKLDSVRLLAIDGDVGSAELPTAKLAPTNAIGVPPDRDGVYDWGVGRYKDSEQGVAVTTTPSLVPLPSPFTCADAVREVVTALVVDDGRPPNCDVAPSEVTRHDPQTSRRLVEMPTYALNSLAFVPGTDDAEAWAAGDRGAIVRLRGTGGVAGANEPPAPKLREQAETSLSDSTPFDAFRPVSMSTQPGTVPSLGMRPVEELSRPAVDPYGTSDPTRWIGLPREDVAALAMSRDGSEGWAVGSGHQWREGDGFTLQRFDGERWRRCDIDGLRGSYAPDTACSGLAPLLARTRDGKPEPPTLTAIARIPLERDHDRSNDDEFEAIAIGSPIQEDTVDGDATVLRYLNGKWEVDQEATKVIDSSLTVSMARIAFRGPDDGWLVTYAGFGVPLLYHYGPDDDGRGWPHGRWVKCAPDVADPLDECGDGIETLPSGIRATGGQFHVAGDTTFYTGMRSVAGGRDTAPFVFAREGNGPWTSEYDACQDPPTCADFDSGKLASVSLTELENGDIVGWMVGVFGPDSRVTTGGESDDKTRGIVGPQDVLMRRQPNGEWAFHREKDAADDYLPYASVTLSQGPGVTETAARVLSFRGSDGGERSFILPSRRSSDAGAHFPPLEYDPASNRWKVLPAPWLSRGQGRYAEAESSVTAAAPDNQGGLWLTGRPISGQGNHREITPHRATFFYRYSVEQRKPPFEQVSNPISEPISSLAGRPNGSVWVSTHSDRLYHYDRIRGWERVRIKGWDPGRVVTKPSSVFAVAVNGAGEGVAVGEDGRIANLSERAVGLDPASGRRCSDGPPPCGTPRDLRAAAVAPDGSALVGGERLTLMWRSAHGDFRLVERPRTLTSAGITGLSMPLSHRAWLTTSHGEVWRGDLVGSTWRWMLESGVEASRDERQSRRNPNGKSSLHAIAVDPAGRGLAVGDRGAMLERSADGTWRRLKTGFMDDLWSVALPSTGYGDGTLVGGGLGVILTRVGDEFRLARSADMNDPLTNGPSQVASARIIGLAIAGGGVDGAVETWAASQVPLDAPGDPREPQPFALLHYASDDDPLMNPDRRVKPLPDAPAREGGELTFAAFGRGECQLTSWCAEMHGTNLFHERLNRRILDDLRARADRTGDGFMTVFTGDIAPQAGRGDNRKGGYQVLSSPATPLDKNVQHERWLEAIVAPLHDHGIPLFAPPGRNDLSRPATCTGGGTRCVDTADVADAGLSLPWRTTFARMPEPWGDGDAFERGPYEFVPVTRSGPKLEPEADVKAPDQAGGPRKIGGARTHYAIDVKRDGEKVARVIFIDNSFARSMTAGEASQNPIEVQGGQASWLERVLCIRGETCASGGSREPGQTAVVVTNAPSYSYGPGGLDSVQSDGSLFESLLLRHKATAAIAGRLGWNGLYYTIGAGVHAPCPGGEYPSGPPDTSASLCDRANGAAQQVPPLPAGKDLAEALRGSGAPLPAQTEHELGAVDGLRRAIPNLVASSAGGRFGPDGGDDGAASQGYWHGYSVMRLRANGEVIVEQRPIFDFVGITAQEHTLKPGQKVTLRGYGREPLGTDTTVRIDRIDSPAITHRYDLVLADESNPALPKEDAEGDYIPLDPTVATVDAQTGVVSAGKGRRARTHAIGILSVGDSAASWPLVFEPAKSFRPRPALLSTVRPPAASLPVTQQAPAIRVLSSTPTQPPTSPPPPVVAPTIGDLSLPSPPKLPSITGPPAATPTAAPPPPVPPPPPSTAEALPLSLQAPITPVSIVPTVIPPTPPPINPAPPGGSAARKEARQRQAATAKSEEGAAEREQDAAGDLVDQKMPPHGAAMTRRDRVRPGVSFTTIARADQPSAWTRSALSGGGIAILAFVLAAGWIAGKPRARGRPPEIAAPAWTHRRR